jgi:putative polyhydroxyalkanoate system protein
MSRPITVTLPHELGAAEARRRVESGFDKLEQQISGGLAQVEKSWAGDTLSFSAKAVGQSVTGRLQVLESAVKMEVDLPPFLSLIADKIQGRLKKQGRLLLEKK